MDDYTTVLCYTRGEIIDCAFGISYNHPFEKGVSINSIITFDELETKLCHALNINRTYTKLNMGTVNYVPLPIRDDGDVSIMFTVVAQSPPPNTIEMYCQTSSIDYHPMPSSFTTPMHIESLGPSQQMLFDEDDGNEDIMDMEDNENTENDASLLGGGEHDVPSPIFRELNWDAINSMVTWI
ncbi:hypothetical protein AAG906_024607 [Vitis piasezkii]